MWQATENYPGVTRLSQWFEIKINLLHKSVRQNNGKFNNHDFIICRNISIEIENEKKVKLNYLSKKELN